MLSKFKRSWARKGLCCRGAKREDTLQARRGLLGSHCAFPLTRKVAPLRLCTPALPGRCPAFSLTILPEPLSAVAIRPRGMTLSRTSLVSSMTSQGTAGPAGAMGAGGFLDWGSLGGGDLKHLNY